MHWGLLAQKDHKDINLSTLRMLLVADGANPCQSLPHPLSPPPSQHPLCIRSVSSSGSLTSCDSFLNVFQDKGLKPEAICPCASCPETLTVSIRRPGRVGTNASGRGVLSMNGLSYGVVRVDSENSLTSLTLQVSLRTPVSHLSRFNHP